MQGFFVGYSAVDLLVEADTGSCNKVVLDLLVMSTAVWIVLVLDCIVLLLSLVPGLCRFLHATLKSVFQTKKISCL